MFYGTEVMATGSLTLREISTFYVHVTFIYEHDRYSLEIYWMYKYALPTSRLSKNYRLTDRQIYTTELIYHAALRVVK